MFIFLSLFLSLYGLMHRYWYKKAMAAFPLSGSGRWVLALCLLGLMLTPVMVRILERQGLEGAARFTAWVGYSWMGVLFLATVCFLSLDLLSLPVKVAAWAGCDVGYLLPGSRSLFCGVMAIVGGIFLYSLQEAGAIRTEHVELTSDKLPPGKVVTIAQVSDVHLGLMVGERRLAAILAAVRAADPDILVATGDLVDGQMDGCHRLAAQLAAVTPRLGKYAVTGNHERYVGSRQALEFIRQAGFTLLRGECGEIPGLLRICGVDDPAFGGKELAEEQERRLLGEGHPGLYTVLLKHRPLVLPESRGAFDLQLSGHVHKGQIFPFELLTRLQFPLPTGLSPLTEGGSIYVSRGTGTWGPPIRFLAPPEVTLFRISHPKEETQTVEGI